MESTAYSYSGLGVSHYRLPLERASYYLDCAKAMRGISHIEEMNWCLETAIASLKNLGAYPAIADSVLQEIVNISPEQFEQVLIEVKETLNQKPESQQPLEELVLQPA